MPEPRKTVRLIFEPLKSRSSNVWLSLIPASQACLIGPLFFAQYGLIVRISLRLLKADLSQSANEKNPGKAVINTYRYIDNIATKSDYSNKQSLYFEQ